MILNLVQAFWTIIFIGPILFYVVPKLIDAAALYFAAESENDATNMALATRKGIKALKIMVMLGTLYFLAVIGTFQFELKTAKQTFERPTMKADSDELSPRVIIEKPSFEVQYEMEMKKLKSESKQKLTEIENEINAKEETNHE